MRPIRPAPQRSLTFPAACLAAALALAPGVVAPVTLAAGPALVSATSGASSPASASAPAPAVEVAPGRTVSLPLRESDTVLAVTGTSERWFAAGVGASMATGTETADGQELVLFTGDSQRARRLPVPGGRTGALRTDPVVLTAGNALTGLAWLEGDERGALAVRFARWTGKRWTRPEPVAPPAPGTQIALAGSTLADGSLLLLWAGYDGEDDEILWSRRGVDSAWSRPRTVGAGNAVPDVTPAVTALPGGGALAAWSRFDEASAQYLVVAARFDGGTGSGAGSDTRSGTWSAPRAVAPPGTAFPSFENGARAAAPRLLIRTAVPRGWAVLDLDEDGRARRVAHAEAAAPERPVVEDAAGGIDLRWPGAEAATRSLAWEILP